MNDFIKNIIDSCLDQFGKMYVHARPEANLFIGRRGLIGKEQVEGIILTFSKSSCKNLEIAHEGIYGELKFAGVWENVFVPMDSIDAIIDDLQEPNIVFNFLSKNLSDFLPIPEPRPTKNKKTAEILKPDFTKGRK